MSPRPPAIVVRCPAPVPPAPLGWTATTIDALPAEPFALGHLRLAVVGDVVDARDAATYLLAAARGVAVVVGLRFTGPAAEQFLDDLGRLTELRQAPSQVNALSVEHRQLLDALAEGLTLTAAAERLGLSRRTATRRLAEARALLGVSTTVEALRLYGVHPRPSG